MMTNSYLIVVEREDAPDYCEVFAYSTEDAIETFKEAGYPYEIIAVYEQVYRKEEI